MIYTHFAIYPINNRPVELISRTEVYTFGVDGAECEAIVAQVFTIWKNVSIYYSIKPYILGY
jgi:hypothetical protein